MAVAAVQARCQQHGLRKFLSHHRAYVLEKETDDKYRSFHSTRAPEKMKQDNIEKVGG